MIDHRHPHVILNKGAAHTTHQAHGDVDEFFDPEAGGQRRHQQQPGVGHEMLVVEGHLDAVDSARYSLALEVPPGLVLLTTSDIVIVPAQGGFSADPQLLTALSGRWIEGKTSPSHL